MGVNGVGILQKGLYKKNRDLSEGPICVVFPSLCQCEEKLRNTAQSRLSIICEFWQNLRKLVRKMKLYWG
jgi:hypothetical protein